MRDLFKVAVISIIVCALVLSSCADSGTTGSEITPRPTSASPPTGVLLSSPEVEATPMTILPTETLSSSEVVVTSGVVQPSKWVELGFPTSGVVAAVTVRPGDEVNSGQLVARLEAAELEQAVVQAETALELAQARLAQALAGARPEELAVAEADVAAAEADLDVAEAELAAAEAGADIARARLRRVTSESEAAAIPAEAAQARVEEAQAEVTRAEADVEAAQARVSEAAARLERAKAERDLLRAGTAAEELAILEVEVDQAEAALTQAQLALERTRLVAPFAGSVAAVEVQPGETVDRGEPVVVVADLDTLHIRTEDLDQLSVIRIRPGQNVRIWPNALPGRELSGRVNSVPLRGNNDGDVIAFPVIIELVEREPDLRWDDGHRRDYGRTLI